MAMARRLSRCGNASQAPSNRTAPGGSYGFLDEASGDMIVVTLFDADDRARHGSGLPRATLWNTTGKVAVTARSWEELGRGVW